MRKIWPYLWCSCLIGVLIFVFLFYKTSIVRSDVLKEIVEISELYEVNNEIIYFGRDTCPSCVVATQFLQEYLSEEDITISYFNTDTFRDDTCFPTVIKDFNITVVPSLVLVQNGKYIKSVSLVSDSGDLDIEQLYQIFESYKGELL